MSEQKRPSAFSIAAMAFTLAFVTAFLFVGMSVATRHDGNDLYSFSEPVRQMDDGWTLTDANGLAQSVSLPLTVPYGDYTLSNVLPRDGRLMVAPVFRFYSNYTDIAVLLDGREIYAFPFEKAAFNGATGNTYHYIRLPADYAGKPLAVRVHGQLGSDITYLIKAPLIGSKGTMLRVDVMQSLPEIVLSGCMIALAIGIAAMYPMFRRRLGFSGGTGCAALFALLFGVYVFCETSLAQVIVPNGYLLCAVTLMLLSLMPIPLMGMFSDDVSKRLSWIPASLAALNAVNAAVQATLNFAGVMSYRALLPFTHIALILTIAGMAAGLIFSDPQEKPEARRRLLLVLPMIVGGITDIVLLWMEKPSFNNSFFFTVGVSAFIILQFCNYIRKFFSIYRTTLENELYRDMAYRDMLTDIGNRNAYERSLKELAMKPLSERLGCIVLDIDGLKGINDTLGHAAGDTAIVETGKILRMFVPEGGACFRTGGDEFIVLLTDCTVEEARTLSDMIEEEALRRGERCGVPLRLAAGCGCYEESDGCITDFIRRVDALMYGCKRMHRENGC